jgi:hypothetical protein
MKMLDVAKEMERLCGELFAQLEAAFVEDMRDPDFLAEFLCEVGNSPDKYSNILNPKVTRLALAYKGAMDSYMEIDELVDIEHYSNISLEPDEFEEHDDLSANREDVLHFPTEVQVDPYDHPDGDRHDRG